MGDNRITVPSGFEVQYDNVLQNRHGTGGSKTTGFRLSLLLYSLNDLTFST